MVFSSCALRRYNTVTIEHPCYQPEALVQERIYYLKPYFKEHTINMSASKAIPIRSLQLKIDILLLEL